MDTSSDSSPRPLGRLALLTLLAAQGVSGVAGGVGLVLDPSGEALGIPITFLDGSPFSDYLAPGLILLVLLGIGPLIVAWGLRTHRPWARIGSLLVGGGLLVWLAVQIVMIGYQDEPPLQLVYGVLGIAIVLLSLSPSVRDRRPSRTGRS